MGMTPPEIVLVPIHHRATKLVPYALPFQEDVASRLDQRYDDQARRESLVPHIISCKSVDRGKWYCAGDGLSRVLYGSTWRTDRRPCHLEETALKEPTLASLEILEDVGLFVRNEEPRARFAQRGCTTLRSFRPTRMPEPGSSLRTLSPEMHVPSPWTR